MNMTMTSAAGAPRTMECARTFERSAEALVAVLFRLNTRAARRAANGLLLVLDAGALLPGGVERHEP